MHEWLKPNGHISHEIDFKSHGTAREWDGHWTYSNWIWHLIKGRKPFLLNRRTYSDHLSILKEQGFHIVYDQASKKESTLKRHHFTQAYRTRHWENFET